ncbi:kinase-like protein [Hymenopellis radicata]|nr:kinase-like protein [Hymenopellis radicata]
MEKRDLQIDFSLDDNIVPGTPEFNLLKRMRFWEDSARPWLLERGYTLYNHFCLDEAVIRSADCGPYLPNSSKLGGQFPYAFHDEAYASFEEDTGEIPYFTYAWGNVVFAQDKENRHVALKLVRRDSEEFRIMHFLLKAQNERPGKFIPGILPILEILPFAGHWLVVMPRWGDAIASPWFNSVGETLVVIHSLLSALAFLHGSGIVHRDIAPRNTLVNHFALDSRGGGYPLRSAMRKDGRMKYVLFDFNLALMFPASATHASYRLPRKGGFFASLNAPTDLSQGEYDYEPFAFDVGCLGIMFSIFFQHLTPFAPILAPLIDGMETWDVRARFTAEEALQFFEKHVPHFDENLLHAVPRKYDYEEYDRWSELPPEFVHKWAHLRIPLEPITRKILRWICQYRICDIAVQRIRRTVRGLLG